MKIVSPKGILFTQLNIVILSAFVLTASVINYGVCSGIWGFQMETKSMTDNRIDSLLDDIKSQFTQVLSGNDDSDVSYDIVRNGSNDKISIQHNNISYEYYIDSNSNLVKSVERFEKVVAENVNSLKINEIDDNLMEVTISTIFIKSDNINQSEKSTRKYSTVIDRKAVT